ncbi:MAG: enoyl-CoA hydratase-related protein [Pseudomonadota bacterium]
MAAEDLQKIRYSVSDGIASITIDNPPLNLLDRQVTLEYFKALERADADPDVRVIVLSGAGKGLSAGVDIRMMETFNSSDMKQFLSLFYVEMVKRVRALSKPIIAAVHGYAREGACTLAFTCDMVIASDDADFGYPGVPNIAAPPGMHVWHLQRLIGRMKAAELILTGEPISAQEADRLGLVTKVVPRDDLKAATMRLAGRLAEMSPLALRSTRELMYRMETMDFAHVPATALDAVSLAFDSEDSREARKAFNEKRKPVWKGK